MCCIKIKRVWSDENNIELEFSASSVNIFSQLNFYIDKNRILELKEKLIEFPFGNSKIVEWTEGALDENSYTYFYFKAFIIDKVGHASIEIKMDNKLKEPYTLKSHFYIPTEVASINEFGEKLDKLLSNDGVNIEGISFRN